MMQAPVITAALLVSPVLMVCLVFCLLAPKDSGVDHLKALALVSRTMRDQAVVAKLRANTDPAKLHAILTETKATAAA